MVNYEFGSSHSPKISSAGNSVGKMNVPDSGGKKEWAVSGYQGASGG